MPLSPIRAMQLCARGSSRLLRCFALVTTSLACFAGSARCQTCNFTFTDLVFGNVDVTANTNVDITGTMSI